MFPEPWYIPPNFEYTEKTVTIIGAGLAGTSAAYSLAKQGWNVTIIERNDGVGQEASGNPAGIVMPLASHKSDVIGQFYLNGFEHTLRHLENYKKNKIWQQCGVYEINEKKHKIDNIISKEYSEITSKLPENVPLVKEATEYLYLAKAGMASPGLLCQENIKSPNITTIFNTDILSLKFNGIWKIFDSKDKIITTSEVVIIANANDAKSFEQTNWLPIIPVRGQITYLPDIYDFKNIICYERGYITPAIDGYHYVGATFSRDNMDLTPKASDDAENIENLSRYINTKHIDMGKLTGRASLRATTPDRRPIIGPVPNAAKFAEDYNDLKHGKRHKKYPAGTYLKGLYITAGHGSRGLTSCPIAGEIIANYVNSEANKTSPQNILNALNPARFLIRRLKK